jgi:hypothetical protein
LLRGEGSRCQNYRPAQRVPGGSLGGALSVGGDVWKA